MLGCSQGPAYMTLGEQESYCADHEECEPGLFCLRSGEASFCTRACANGDECPSSYTCSRAQGICTPDPDGMCRNLQERCGPGFAPCCEGTLCATFEPFGAYCTEPCSDGWQCTSGCCVGAGNARVCAPPSYCNG